MTQVYLGKFRNWLHGEFSSERLPANLTSGILIGITEAIFAVSLGTLIFSDELVPFISYGVGVALVTTAVTLIGISLTSSISGVIGSSQESPAVVFSIVAISIFGAISATDSEVKLTTVLVGIAVATLMTGLCFLLLGYFNLGGLVRYAPYPVVGGFLAGTGWLLVQGSFAVMADLPITFPNIGVLLQPEYLYLWLPGIIFALVLFFSLRRFNQVWVMPGIVIGAIVLFYLSLVLTDTSINAAIDLGLLMGQFSGEVIWHPLRFSSLPVANWSAILGQTSNIFIIIVLSMIGFLLNVSAIEITSKKDIDLNRELRAAGIVNIISGLGGGMVGYHTLSLTKLNHRSGARGRMAGLIAGTICALMVFVRTSLPALSPKPVLGGILLFLGLEFLYEWVIRGWSKLSRVDYFVVILILVVVATTNFLIGVGVGLVATIILFTVNYSRIEVVRHALSGAEMQSNFERDDYHRQKLKELGAHIYILELQGFIFFGTANSLLSRTRARLSETNQLPVRFIILDFRQVSGLDSSAVLSFIKCRQTAEAQGITLVLTHLSNSIRRQLKAGGLFGDENIVRDYPDLDRGLEWCEDRLLFDSGITRIILPATLHERLVKAGFLEDDVDRLLGYLERVEMDKGEYLVRQGDESNDLYFVESGKLSIYLELEPDGRVRLQTFGKRTIVGEIGLYLGTARTASIIADEPSITYKLSKAALGEMKQKAPALAAALHEFVARQLAERLADTTRLLSTIYQ